MRVADTIVVEHLESFCGDVAVAALSDHLDQCVLRSVLGVELEDDVVALLDDVQAAFHVEDGIVALGSVEAHIGGRPDADGPFLDPERRVADVLRCLGAARLRRIRRLAD